jgi:hypothetical protein
LNLTELSYIHVTLRRFDTLYFLLAFFALLFLLERLCPRFWCRCLCPARRIAGAGVTQALLAAKDSRLHALRALRAPVLPGPFLTMASRPATKSTLPARPA